MKKIGSTSRLDFLSPLSVIPGLGPKRISALRETGVCSLGDILYYFPRRYEDRSVITPAADAGKYLGKNCCIIGEITRTRIEKGRRPRLRIQVTDQSGSIEAVWFQRVAYFRNYLKSGMRILLTGKISRYGSIQIVHPKVESLGSKKLPDVTFQPVYPLTTMMRDVNLQQKTLSSAVGWVFKNLRQYPHILPESIEKKKRFPQLSECLRQLHFPEQLHKDRAYRDRIIYEELYQLALSLRWSKRKFALPGRCISPGNLPDRLRASLPFSLTGGQQQAISTLLKEVESPKRMHRLLQGDVGCGKTVVALFAALGSLNEGYQVAWLTPTEILARQTHNTVSKLLSPLGISVDLLIGSTPAETKRAIRTRLRTGGPGFVIGTHALIQSSMSFKRLGIIIIDEQHRFGAEQRLRLQEQDPSADFLLMSATPIPQTLAQTLYGDLEITTIDDLPAGRKPVKTYLVPNHKKEDMYSFLHREIIQKEGQVFYIVPRIGSDDEEELNQPLQTVGDVQTVYKQLQKTILSDVPTGCIHGRQTTQVQEETMQRFVQKEYKLLIATTIVEVGVDIPDATAIIIENAERFGLSQLHQLRGRVGRNQKESFCFLLTNPAERGDSEVRMKKFCGSHDGFQIAELDLSLRGPGEVDGFRQSGWDDLKMADIIRDAHIFKEIQKELDLLLTR
ncbi:MAG: ATP-dependent DNA helicase RecG [Chitinispirillaceae bacterium]